MDRSQELKDPYVELNLQPMCLWGLNHDLAKLNRHVNDTVQPLTALTDFIFPSVDRTAPMCENVPMGPVGQVEVGMAAGTQVSWEEPTCNDISQTATVTDRTFLPGSSFPVGQTEVIYTCTDASGNSEMCVFSVTVFEGNSFIL